MSKPKHAFDPQFARPTKCKHCSIAPEGHPGKPVTVHHDGKYAPPMQGLKTILDHPIKPGGIKP